MKTEEMKLSVNILVRKEKMNNKKVFIINNEEIGVADFGDRRGHRRNLRGLDPASL